MTTNPKPTDARLRWNCECSKPLFEGEEYLAQDGAIRCPNCHRPLSGDPASTPPEAARPEGLREMTTNPEPTDEPNQEPPMTKQFEAELVERVARAISIPQHHTTWDILTWQEKDLFYTQADYAISAMRSATPQAEDGLHPLTLSEIADQQFDEALKASFLHGAQAMREMLARFVENSPPIDLKVMAGSMRANWYPAWGDDPGQTSELPRSALGDTDQRDARHSRFAARAVEHAMKLLDEQDAALATLVPQSPAPSADGELVERMVAIANRDDTTGLAADALREGAERIAAPSETASQERR
jgi:hypothetical protein